MSTRQIPLDFYAVQAMIAVETEETRPMKLFSYHLDEKVYGSREELDRNRDAQLYDLRVVYEPDQDRLRGVYEPEDHSRLLQVVYAGEDQDRPLHKLYSPAVRAAAYAALLAEDA